MATYIIKINERTQIGRAILQVMLSFPSIFTVRKINSRTINKEARAIAREVRGVKNGTIKTRPMSCLLEEL